MICCCQLKIFSFAILTSYKISLLFTRPLTALVTSSISWYKLEQSSQVLRCPSEQCLFFARLGSLGSDKANEMQCDGQSECSIQFWGYTIFKYLFEHSNQVRNVCFHPRKSIITFSKDLKPFKPSAIVSSNPARLFRCDGLSSFKIL